MNSGSLNPPRCRMGCANPTKKNWALGDDPVAPPGAPPHLQREPDWKWAGGGARPERICARGPGSLAQQVVRSGVLWPLSCSQGQEAWKVDSLLLRPNGWSGGTRVAESSWADRRAQPSPTKSPSDGADSPCP